MPSADSTTPPLIDATFLRIDCVLFVSHCWMSAADTDSSSRAKRATGPMTGYCSSCVSTLPSSLKFLPWMYVDQRARLVSEYHAQEGERCQQRERRETRDEARRVSRAAAELAREPEVERVEQEGEEDRPGHRAGERLKHQQHAVGDQRGERDEEGFCVELHVHP